MRPVRPPRHRWPSARRSSRQSRRGDKLWGSQSWLQPAFSRPLPREDLLTSRKSRLKGGCRQDCLPHNKCRTSPTEKYAASIRVSGTRLPAGRAKVAEEGTAFALLAFDQRKIKFGLRFLD